MRGTSTSRRTPTVRRPSRFDRLMRSVLKTLYPGGTWRYRFLPKGKAGHPHPVRPDFVLPDGTWVLFHRTADLEETGGRPSAALSAIRKHVDHSANASGRLILIFGTKSGAIAGIPLPLKRGRDVIIATPSEWRRRVTLWSARDVVKRVPGARGRLYARWLEKILDT